jgi:hypothetical protein
VSRTRQGGGCVDVARRIWLNNTAAVPDPDTSSRDGRGDVQHRNGATDYGSLPISDMRNGMVTNWTDPKKKEDFVGADFR